MKTALAALVIMLASLASAQTITAKVLTVTELWADDNGAPVDPTHFYEGYLITLQIGTATTVTAACQVDRWVSNGTTWLTHVTGERGNRKGLIACGAGFHAGQMLTMKTVNERLIPIKWEGVTGSWEPATPEDHLAGYEVISE